MTKFRLRMQGVEIWRGDYGDEVGYRVCCAESHYAKVDLARMVIADNACVGIPSDALEAGIVGKMLEALKMAKVRLEFVKEKTLSAEIIIDAVIRKAEGR